MSAKFSYLILVSSPFVMLCNSNFTHGFENSCVFFFPVEFMVFTVLHFRPETIFKYFLTAIVEFIYVISKSEL